MHNQGPQRSLGSRPYKNSLELRTLRQGTSPYYPLQSVSMHSLHTLVNLSLERYVWCTGVQPQRLWGPPATENEETVGPLEGRRLVGTSLQCQPLRQNDVDENGGERTQGFAVGRFLLATICSMTYRGI